MKNEKVARRKFLKNAALTAGAVAAGSLGYAHGTPGITLKDNGRLPREVWIAGISQQDLTTQTYQQMADEIIRIMNTLVIYQPDIICLSEIFPTSNVAERYSFSERVDISVRVTPRFAEFAKQNRCYVICPVYTTENGKVYNSAIVFDRDGISIGEYRKIHLTEGEIANGITPGPLQPPVFRTDFGVIGIQICFDILWDDAWARLREQGAEIVFWPSAYGGGQTVNTKAWQNKYVVASGTRKGTAKICDISGKVLAQTGFWDKNYYCAPVNLEKVFLHTWPYVREFDNIRRKYGRKVLITNYDEEEWSIIESLSADVSISRVMEEFNLKSFEEHTRTALEAQIRARGKV